MSKLNKYTIYNLGNGCVIKFPKSLEGMKYWTNNYKKNKINKWMKDTLKSTNESKYKDLTENEVKNIKISQEDNLKLHIVEKEFIKKYIFLDKNVKIVLKHYLENYRILLTADNINLQGVHNANINKNNR